MGALTRRQQTLLNILRFRAAGETDPERLVCWLHDEGRGHWRLIVPSLVIGEWGSVHTWSEGTLRALEAEDLLTRSELLPLPEYVRFRGHTTGVKVQLTDLPVRA